MFGVLEAISVPHNGIYNTYEDLFRDLNERVGKDGYKIVKARSHRSRINGQLGADMVRCDLVCDRGGRPYKSMATKHKTTTKKTGCPWKAKAVHRKTIGGWVLTIACDQHNHEPGTPEPPTPSEASEAEENEDPEGEDLDADNDGPRPDPETSAAMQVAGVSNAVLQLTGETFHQFKRDYRKMSQPERLGILSQLQLRIAAIYAVQNEDVQRNARAEAQRKRYEDIDASRAQRQQQKKARRQQQQQQQRQQAGQDGMHQQQHLGTPTQAHMHPQQMPTPQQQQHHMTPQNQPQHAQHMPPNQQFHMPPDNESQQLMAISGISGMDLGIPQQPQQPQYPGPPKRIRGHRPSPNGQQTPQQQQPSQ